MESKLLPETTSQDPTNPLDVPRNSRELSGLKAAAVAERDGASSVDSSVPDSRSHTLAGLLSDPAANLVPLGLMTMKVLCSPPGTGIILITLPEPVFHTLSIPSAVAPTACNSSG